MKAALLLLVILSLASAEKLYTLCEDWSADDYDLYSLDTNTGDLTFVQSLGFGDIPDSSEPFGLAVDAEGGLNLIFGNGQSDFIIRFPASDDSSSDSSSSSSSSSSDEPLIPFVTDFSQIEIYPLNVNTYGIAALDNGELVAAGGDLYRIRLDQGADSYIDTIPSSFWSGNLAINPRDGLAYSYDTGDDGDEYTTFLRANYKTGRVYLNQVVDSGALDAPTDEEADSFEFSRDGKTAFILSDGTLFSYSFDDGEFTPLREVELTYPADADECWTLSLPKATKVAGNNQSGSKNGQSGKNGSRNGQSGKAGKNRSSSSYSSN